MVTYSVQRTALHAATALLAHAGPRLARIRPLRRLAVSRVEAWLRSNPAQISDGRLLPPGTVDDRVAMSLAVVSTIERALTECNLASSALHGLIQVLLQSVLLERGDHTAVNRFHAQYGTNPPGFLLISPTKTCNLRCVGCYADSGATTEKLEWEVFDRIIDEARTLWGARFIVISGGEPLAYRSGGRDLLDMAMRHPDCYFMMYTNGTLIDNALAARLARVGNLMPAISLEGWRERTDARRGPGVFDRVLAAMAALRRAGVVFGVSLTATRHNAEEILADDLISFLFEKQGALFGWIFHYMPIGRAFTLDLMPTPEQRAWMWRRSWEIVRQRRILLADFWNHGTVSDGCLSAGRYNGGGYMSIDWNGAVSPCVFLPYSPVNIKHVYEQGGTLNDIWADPFFAGIRQWQRDYAARDGNWLAPCPMRDHHAELRRLLARHEPDPTDGNARAALLDPEYARGLDRYDAAYEELSSPLWRRYHDPSPR